MRRVSQTEIREHVAFANQLAAWLRKAEVTKIAGGSFADIIRASQHIETELLRMMRLNLDRPDHAKRALGHLRYLRVLLFTEIGHDLRELRKAWPHLELRLRSQERQIRREYKAREKRKKKRKKKRTHPRDE